MVSLLLAVFCVYKTSDAVIKPLRVLNKRMSEMLQEENYNEVNFDMSSSCQEIGKLQNDFKSLINDYKFTQNVFLKQESDVIALIDLAEACVLFSGQNYKSAGICYNNIANIHFRNQKYKFAAESFNKAVLMAYICLGEMTPEDFYAEFKDDRPRRLTELKHGVDKDSLTALSRRHFQTVRAHRYY